MFTGIVETTCAVLERTDSELTLARPSMFSDLHIGSSISVSGVCLSVTYLNGQSMKFDVTEETWRRTNLPKLAKGDRVNLERAMKADARFEGHIVQGHVDGVGEVKGFPRASPGSASREAALSIRYPKSLQGLIVEKGSIAIDGVSLTVVAVAHDTFSVALIPQTLQETTLGSLKEGDLVNLEADVVGKYVMAAIS